LTLDQMPCECFTLLYRCDGFWFHY
jgi:hypothetical protein